MFFVPAGCLLHTHIPLDFPEQYRFKFGPEAHETNCLLFLFLYPCKLHLNDHVFLKMLHAVHNLMACLREGNVWFTNGSWT